MAGLTRAGRSRRAKAALTFFGQSNRRRQPGAAGFLPVALWLLLGVLAACAPRGASSGALIIRVADGSDGLAGLDRVVITVHDAAIHPQDRPRDEGWVELELVTPSFALGADGPTGALVGRGPIPPGPYDRVRVEVAEVYGERGGQRVPIRNIVEPIYLPKLITGGPAEVQLQFIVLPLLRPDSEEPFAVYTKAVTVR
ncbi:MAG: hypothetical protein KIT87_21435 [Anaerolineae bacterium]|nr:hypothetical protein [Anaerolineae bacterium]